MPQSAFYYVTTAFDGHYSLKWLTVQTWLRWSKKDWHHHRQITYTAQAKPAVGHYISQDHLCVGMHLPFWSRYQNTLSTCDILLVHSRDSFQKSISSCTFPFARCRNTISCCHMWERDQLTFQIIVHFLIKGMVHGAQFVHTPFSHDAAV